MIRNRTIGIVFMIISLLHLGACESNLTELVLDDNSRGSNNLMVENGMNGMSALTTDDGGFNDTQQFVFEELFGSSYDPDYISYFMDEVIGNKGQFSGANQHGDQFTLNVLVHAPVALEDLDLSPEDLQAAQNSNLQFSGVMGWIQSGNRKIAVGGMAMSGNIRDLGHQARFMVQTLEDPTTPLYNPMPMALIPLPVHGSVNGNGDDLVFTQLLTDCEEECMDAFDDAVSDAQDQHDSDVAAADAEFETAMNNAANDRQDGYDDAASDYNRDKGYADAALAAAIALETAAMLKGLLTCASVTVLWSIFTGGAATIVCMAAVSAAYVAAAAIAKVAHNGVMAGIRDNYNEGIGTANAAYNTAKSIAENTRDQAKSEAADALDSALEQAQTDLEDCLRDCRRKVREQHAVVR